MKTIVKILALFIGTMTYAGSVDLTKELKELNKHYLSLNEFELDFEISYFDWNQNQLMRRNGQVVHTDKLHYVNLGGNITLIKNQSYLSVNKGFKTMIYSNWESDKKSEEGQSVDISSLVDSLWKNQQGLTYNIIETNDNKVRVELIDPSNTSFSSFEMLVDINTDRLLEFHCKMRPGINQSTIGEIVIEYTRESSKVKVRAPYLKMNHYIQKSGQNIEPSKNFGGYQIIDQNEIINNYE